MVIIIQNLKTSGQVEYSLGGSYGTWNGNSWCGYNGKLYGGFIGMDVRPQVKAGIQDYSIIEYDVYTLTLDE